MPQKRILGGGRGGDAGAKATKRKAKASSKKASKKAVGSKAKGKGSKKRPSKKSAKTEETSGDAKASTKKSSPKTASGDQEASNSSYENFNVRSEQRTRVRSRVGGSDSYTYVYSLEGGPVNDQLAQKVDRLERSVRQLQSGAVSGRATPDRVVIGGYKPRRREHNSKRYRLASSRHYSPRRHKSHAKPGHAIRVVASSSSSGDFYELVKVSRPRHKHIYLAEAPGSSDSGNRPRLDRYLKNQDLSNTGSYDAFTPYKEAQILEREALMQLTERKDHPLYAKQEPVVEEPVVLATPDIAQLVAAERPEMSEHNSDDFVDFAEEYERGDDYVDYKPKPKSKDPQYKTDVVEWGKRKIERDPDYKNDTVVAKPRPKPKKDTTLGPDYGTDYVQPKQAHKKYRKRIRPKQKKDSRLALLNQKMTVFGQRLDELLANQSDDNEGEIQDLARKLDDVAREVEVVSASEYSYYTYETLDSYTYDEVPVRPRRSRSRSRSRPRKHRRAATPVQQPIVYAMPMPMQYPTAAPTHRHHSRTASVPVVVVSGSGSYSYSAPGAGSGKGNDIDRLRRQFAKLESRLNHVNDRQERQAQVIQRRLEDAEDIAELVEKDVAKIGSQVDHMEDEVGNIKGSKAGGKKGKGGKKGGKKGKKGKPSKSSSKESASSSA